MNSKKSVLGSLVHWQKVIPFNAVY